MREPDGDGAGARRPRPPRGEFLPFSPPLLGQEEEAEILDSMRSGWLTTGPKTEEFERRFAEYVGAPCAVAFNSCTAGLHLSMIVHGIGEGDEVIVPTYTFASTAHAVMYVRARPVLVDSEPDTLNLSPERVEAAITPRTRAIIPVHYGGQPCELDEIRAIAARHGLVVVEDAAHATGASYRGQKIGGGGNIACFSFYSTKNMTTGEGGMAALADPDLAEQLRVHAMYGISDARRIWKKRAAKDKAPPASWLYDVQHLGYKYNMMDLQAALGIHQLRRLDGFIERRRRFAALYTEAFADLDAIEVPPPRPHLTHAWHLFTILLRLEALTIDRDRFLEELKARQIGTSVLYRPLHLHTLYAEALGHREGSFPVAEEAFRRCISLPMSPRMSEEDVLDVIEAVREVARDHRR